MIRSGKSLWWRLVLGVAVLAGAAAARAQVTDTVRTDNVTAQLVSEHAAVKPGGTAWVALRFAIRPGWHTYWKNPGDSGEATEIAWTLPAEFSAGKIVWPAPGRYVIGPVTNYGYSGTAMHLVPIAVPASARPGARVRLEAEASWLVCEKICIPESGKFAIALFVAEEPPIDERWREAFAAARAALPKALPWTARLVRAGGNLVVRIEGAVLDPARIAEIRFFAGENGAIVHSAPQAVTHDGKGFSIAVKAGPKLGEMKELDGVLAVRERLDGGEVTQSFAVAAPVTAGPAATGADPGMTFGLAVLFALLGGLILNIMPCVFPVLSMKALSLAQHGAGGHARAHALSYTAGVLALFALAGAAILVLRGMGQEVGWGFQLQEPAIVMALAFVMFAIGLNLSGVFEIGGRIAGLGSGLAARGGLSGSFFTGALAVIVAAPCTVPFMAGAVGFAFTQSAPVVIAVMLALGLGMALPFLLLAFVPRALSWMPKPGPWMLRFKQALAFPMYATAVWLVWVLSLQAGDNALLAALGGAVVIAFAAWLWNIASGKRWAAAAPLLGVLAAAALIAWVARQEPATAVEAKSDSRWAAFTPERLEALRREGRPVFVNFTAAWCVTCIVNEKAALQSEAVFAAMTRKGMVPMKADWTRKDATIARELAKFGRNGVPLYVFYPAAGDAREPVVMPQILTESALLAEIDKFPDSKPTP